MSEKRRFGLAGRLLIVLFGVATVSMAVTGMIGYSAGRNSLEREAFNKLRAVREIKRHQVLELFVTFEAQIDVFRNDPFVQTAMRNAAQTFGQEHSVESPAWRDFAADLDSIMHTVVDKFGWYDVFLITTTGDIAYSLVREPDLGMNIPDSPLADTSIGTAYRAANEYTVRPRLFGSPDVAFGDFAPYPPSNDAPASFLMAPIHDGKELLGFFAFQIPLDEINHIMQERSGLGKTGETYLVGPDFLMRSDSFLDPDHRSVGASFDGTVSENGVDTKASREALEGRGGEKIIADYRGVPVLSAYTPLEIYGVRWALMAEIDRVEAFAEIEATRRATLVGLLILIPALLIVSVVFARTITSALGRLARSASELARHDFFSDEEPQTTGHLERVMARSDEIGDLARSFETMGRDLVRSITDLKSTTVVKERMEGELNIARDIQMSMLPLTFPAFPDRQDFSVYAQLHPAREVGGDFYDFFFGDDQKFFLCIADVSGKGVPSALFMAVAKTLIKSRAATDFSPASILSHVNTDLSRNNESCMFVTIFLAVLDVTTGRTTYTNAGHNPPYIKRADGELVRLDQRHGPVIGAVEGIAYREDEGVLDPGDLFLMFTDGVTEAMDVDNALYGEDRLKNLLSQQEFDSAEQMVDLVVDDVWTYQGEAEQADDVTVLAVSYQGVSARGELGHLDLQVANRTEEIARLNQGFNDFAEQHGVPDGDRRRINLVFDELLNNVISYAFDDDQEHVIDVAVSLERDRLVVTIADDGRPFNPFGRIPPETDLPVDDRDIGGLGLHLVKNVMDEVTYERLGMKNVATLIKNIELQESNG
jgi:sigma-B regulation protein RsbU (phosphoserine phosphatase)